MKTILTEFGFKMGDLIKVERIASEYEKRRWASIQVTCMNGTIYEIQASPRKSYLTERKVRKNVSAPCAKVSSTCTRMSR